MGISPRFLNLLKEMEDMHRRKNKAYAGEEGEIDPYRAFRFNKILGVSPLLGCLVRMGDKFFRLSNLVKNPNLDEVGESIKDTLLDLAVYSLIAICLYEEEQETHARPERTPIPGDVSEKESFIENSRKYLKTEVL